MNPQSVVLVLVPTESATAQPPNPLLSPPRLPAPPKRVAVENVVSMHLAIGLAFAAMIFGFLCGFSSGKGNISSSAGMEHTVGSPGPFVE